MPTAKNTDGRPVWGPPVLDYAPTIGEEYEKKKEAVMKFTGNDVARTTEIMDATVEEHLLWEYWEWCSDQDDETTGSDAKQFFADLWEEVNKEQRLAFNQRAENRIYVDQKEDGTWYAYDYKLRAEAVKKRRLASGPECNTLDDICQNDDQVANKQPRREPSSTLETGFTIANSAQNSFNFEISIEEDDDPATATYSDPDSELEIEIDWSKQDDDGWPKSSARPELSMRSWSYSAKAPVLSAVLLAMSSGLHDCPLPLALYIIGRSESDRSDYLKDAPEDDVD